MNDLSAHLQRTSRTFGLAIPLLPEPLRTQVTVAYLLFRTADTLEDGILWPREVRRQALADFAQVLSDQSKAADLASAWSSQPPVEHDGYVRLLAALPQLCEHFNELQADVRELVREHCLTTVNGMAEFVGRKQVGEWLRLVDLDDLRHYCYIVAGLVGEMLTELFVRACSNLEPVAEELRRRAGPFGESLQLVNILKDADSDARERRQFLPSGVSRDEIIRQTQVDLCQAEEYLEILRSADADAGVIHFCSLPILLARATLTAIEQRGQGAKVSRSEVATLVQSLRSSSNADVLSILPEFSGSTP